MDSPWFMLPDPVVLPGTPDPESGGSTPDVDVSG